MHGLSKTFDNEKRLLHVSTLLHYTIYLTITVNIFGKLVCFHLSQFKCGGDEILK